MTPLITVDHLSMEFDGKKVLNNISFELQEGEILGIIGRSGAGKTVLIHLMRGVEQPPTSGRIIYHVAACGGCEYLTAPSAAGTACPVCGGTLTVIDVDLWNEANEQPETTCHAPHGDHVPAHVCPVRKRPGH